MGKKMLVKKGKRYGIALICSILIVVFSLSEPRREQIYDIVVLGDSVVANPSAETHLLDILESRLGKTVFNGAFGGTTMAFKTDLLWGSFASNEWSMVKLAEAICYNDWKSQNASIEYAVSYEERTVWADSYFEERMEGLQQIDFSRVELLIIEHGTNDYNNGIRLDNPQDLYDETTFGGALRRSLRLLQQTYPDLRIVLVSPLYCSLGDDGKCFEKRYGQGGTLDEYVSLEREIAAEYGVEWINAYEDSGIWIDNAEVYLGDGLHPNASGHELLGGFLADYFETK